MVQSQDGSFTAYSHEYEEHYHSTRDGALYESLHKHVIPAFSTQGDKDAITILDICFGLGFNTLATLYYLRQEGLANKIAIHSPELDEALVRSLKDFTYPEVFAPFMRIIETLSVEGYYEDEQVSIKIYFGDARDYLRTCEQKFDIVYQDAFSPKVNPILWTKEYFADIARSMHEDGVLTTYSTALKTRLALHENGIKVYLSRVKGIRDGTIASKTELEAFDHVDMAHKISCNPDVRPLRDDDLQDENS